MSAGTQQHTSIAWHYTTGQKFALIQKNGVLRPAHIGVLASERPVIWFSTNPVFEPTAAKAFVVDGVRRMLTVREMYDLAGGVVRLGCRISRLKSGADLRKAAKMQPAIWNVLASVGKRLGASPAEWWGYVGALMLDDVTVEMMNDDLTWSSHDARVFV
ncbi:hypothetical protein JAB6_29430 [Janthinobacterium sp. HH104]|uniref:hypothetical protein n=1 Tax=Janthinobacterium sp. HH104 TaxID=1537276 RepID=UPI00087467B7|nr:hypothetical protein [Janthinobacterium sp. HH104]OEZ83366.1 hypothetical protein JAB6_29430 [Janthinobacterium sp. HH104]